MSMVPVQPPAVEMSKGRPSIAGSLQRSIVLSAAIPAVKSHGTHLAYGGSWRGSCRSVCVSVHPHRPARHGGSSPPTGDL